MKRVFIDSDVLIDVLRQDTTASAVLQAVSQQATLSVILQMEIMQGCLTKELLQSALRLLKRLELAHLSETISETADQLVTQFHLSHGLKAADALIAATAIVHGGPLLTKNQRDYRYLPGLQLLPYPTTA